MDRSVYRVAYSIMNREALSGVTTRQAIQEVAQRAWPVFASIWRLLGGTRSFQALSTFRIVMASLFEECRLEPLWD